MRDPSGISGVCGVLVITVGGGRSAGVGHLPGFAPPAHRDKAAMNGTQFGCGHSLGCGGTITRLRR